MKRKPPVHYSDRPLAAKLGLQAGMRAAALDAPAHYLRLLAPVPAGLMLANSLDRRMDFIHVFATKRAQLARRLTVILKRLNADGILWISWPKRSSAVATDLDENIIRALGLAAGLVDVKVCAVDQTWSGLKFVYRLKDR